MQTFSKEERLHEKKIIKELFEKGRVFYLGPFKVVWIHCEYEGKYPAKVLISVPARNFKKATDRNYIKRMMREAYRKNKNIIYDAWEAPQSRIVFMLHYSEKIIISFNEVENKIIFFQRNVYTAYAFDHHKIMLFFKKGVSPFYF